MKKIIKKQAHVVIMLSLSFLALFIIYLTDEKVEHTEITIEQGDTLWELSNLYRGKMSTEDWIAYVKKANNLTSNHLKIGDEMIIPVEANSYYIAYKKVEEYEGNIEIASDLN